MKFQNPRNDFQFKNMIPILSLLIQAFLHLQSIDPICAAQTFCQAT